MLKSAVPILFVRDVAAAATFYIESLGFDTDFLHGEPPFYGSVSRGSARLHLRQVHRPTFAALAATEPSLILATIECDDVAALHVEFGRRGVDMPQGLIEQGWGGTDFHVRDPDGNTVSFVQFASSPPPATLERMCPFFIVRDVDASLAFYRHRLGFELWHRAEAAWFFAVIGRDGAQLFLKSGRAEPTPNRSRDADMRWDAYVSVQDPDALAREFAARAVSFSRPLADTHDGLRGFELTDPDGYTLFFGRPR